MSQPPDDNARQYGDSAKLATRARFQQYTIAPTPWFSWVAQHLPVASGADVLDIGCGPGWFWAAAVAVLPEDLRLTLTDLSPGMVDEAVTRCAPLPFGSVTGQEADAAALPFADATFDAVVAMHMLYHVPDPAGAIAEMARVLKPGGVALVTTNGADNMREIYQFLMVLGAAPIEPVAALFGFDHAERLLKQAFGAVARYDYPARMYVTDGGDVFAMLTSFPPGDSAAPDALADLKAAIDAAFAAAGGALDVRRQTGVFVARKTG